MTATASGLNGIPEDSEDEEYARGAYDDGDEADQRTAQETKGWNLFREMPVKRESGSMATSKWIDMSVKILKLLAYVVIFIVVLGAAVLAKGTLLFITSHLKKDREVIHCNKALVLDQHFLTTLSLEERITWLWAAIIVFALPEFGIFLRSVRICFFKTARKPTTPQFIVAFVIETLHAIGMAILMIIILPELDVVKGAMVMSGMCIIPGILNVFTRDRTDAQYSIKLILDVLSISAQATAFVLWPLLQDENNILWYLPLACVFASLTWWENFIGVPDKNSPAVYMYLGELRDALKKTRYYTQRFLTIWKIIVFGACVMVSLHYQHDIGYSLFSKASTAFGERNYTAQEYHVHRGLVGEDMTFDFTGRVFIIPASSFSALWVALIQVLSAYLCFISGKFACKILIQTFSFTFALNLVGPLTVNLLIVFCALRNSDPCAFHGTIPDYLFFEIPPVYTLGDYVRHEMAWVWLLWLVSQAWICLHAWQPHAERLAATDKLFTKPWYDGALIDQSLLMNRSKDEETDISVEDLKDEARRNSDSSFDHDTKIKPSDTIPRVYICATMWHETKDEMIEFLKSIFRLDEDQSSQRVARKYLGIINNDYYELEAHIFMDDAFEVSDHSIEDSQVNQFVKCLVNTIDEAASEVHVTNVRLRPPKKFPTPYGGQLVWTLPGKNKLICHLKDKAKIRHRKRWSQVMYMYYLLGHRLMDIDMSVDRKEVIAENTYLLALDGDIDFQPSAVTLLIDLMKKDKNLGAACGRIHPVGSGFMAWYQKFEYAIGHWLQKATEHMIGCVLCSPGCFSLFRGKALMDDNVMKKYTMTSNEARHYVQYDQGEDRWLCTLLLQRGYRVEYSAASDAYTHCPERFDEFYNQRRRWVPSTMANILDLLVDSKHTVKVNDNISTLYILYQIMLMVGTVLGPGTIFLMMVGALNAITGMSNMTALLVNLIPIAIYITVCMTCKSEIQIMLANAITCAYAMMMMLVIIGIALQITEDGWLAPSSVFTIITFGSFFITAAMHPQEMICLLYIGVYYITIPSMYMLLIIYSLCNLNNVSWGTREVVQKKTAKEMESELKAAEENNKKMNDNALAKLIGNTDEESGSLECGVAGLFKCMCCTNPKDRKEDLYHLQVCNYYEKIDKKLDVVCAGAEADPSAAVGRRRTSLGLRRESAAGARRESSAAALRRESALGLRRESMHALSEYAESEDSIETPKEERDGLVNPFWIEDPDLQKGEVDFLMTAEIEFWKDVIDEYLRPIDENPAEEARIKRDLKNLRNTMVFAFVMLNALFVLTIFLLQLNQDQVHIRWPFGQAVVLSYDDDMNIVHINREYLMLEPIGSLFLVFFGSVMLIQFTAMMFHRLGTLTHLLATVELNWYITKKATDMTDHARVEKDGVTLARKLQKADMSDLNGPKIDENDVSRRKTLHNLEATRTTKSNMYNLDKIFIRRLTILGNAKPEVIAKLNYLGGDLKERRATLRALQTRESIMMEKRRSIMMMNGGRPSVAPIPDYIYSMPSTSGIMPRRDTSASLYGPRQGYQPAESSDEEELPRQSVVRFRENYA